MAGQSKDDICRCNFVDAGAGTKVIEGGEVVWSPDTGSNLRLARDLIHGNITHRPSDKSLPCVIGPVAAAGSACQNALAPCMLPY